MKLRNVVLELFTIVNVYAISAFAVQTVNQVFVYYG